MRFPLPHFLSPDHFKIANDFSDCRLRIVMYRVSKNTEFKF
jgi:hypothetical protein